MQVNGQQPCLALVFSIGVSVKEPRRPHLTFKSASENNISFSFNRVGSLAGIVHQGQITNENLFTTQMVLFQIKEMPADWENFCISAFLASVNRSGSMKAKLRVATSNIRCTGSICIAAFSHIVDPKPSWDIAVYPQLRHFTRVNIWSAV